VGDCFQKFGDVDASADEAQDLADGALAWLIAEEIVSGELTDCALGGLAHAPGRCRVKALRDAGDTDGLWISAGIGAVNGLQVHVGRQVYFGGGGGVSDAGCPKCGGIEPFRDFSAALNDWFKAGVPDHACPLCSQRSLTNDWILEPQWGVGHLQLTFWNWPQLSEQFRQDISVQLNGHRLVYLYDKL
jgi:hypothetical protein